MYINMVMDHCVFLYTKPPRLSGGPIKLKRSCKYHIVFAPKYRRKAFYEARRLEVGKILRQLCEWKGVNIIEAEVCVDHIHMLVEIPPKMSVSAFVGFLKGKSSQIIFESRAMPETEKLPAKPVVIYLKLKLLFSNKVL